MIGGRDDNNAILICVFVAWKWGVSNALAEMNSGGNLPAPALWATMVRYVCPVAVALVLIYAAVNNEYM